MSDMQSDPDAERVDMLLLRHALEVSWSKETSYLGGFDPANSALGQCYVTARVVEHFFPETQVVKGDVWSATTIDTHFWNVLPVGKEMIPIDFTWQQFSPGSYIRSYRRVLSDISADREVTRQRYELLKSRVVDCLTSARRD